MIPIDYRRYGILKSKEVSFSDHVPATDGYHFVILVNCYNEISYDHFDRRAELATVLIDLTQDIDKIFGQVHKNKRKMIRRGLKMAYEVIPLVPTMSLLKEFKRLFNQSIVKKGAMPIITLDYFRALIPYMTIMKVLYEGKTLVMMQIIHDGKIAKTHRLAYNYAGAVENNIRDYMGDVLYWQAIMYFKQLGYQTMDLGGIELEKISSLQGYTKFKISFGGKITPIFWYEIAVTPVAQALMSVRKVVDRNLGRVVSTKLWKTIIALAPRM